MATTAKPRKPKTAAKPKAAKPKAKAKAKLVNHRLTTKTAAKPKAKSRVVVLEQHGAGFLGKIFPVLGAMGL